MTKLTLSDWVEQHRSLAKHGPIPEPAARMLTDYEQAVQGNAKLRAVLELLREERAGDDLLIVHASREEAEEDCFRRLPGTK